MAAKLQTILTKLEAQYASIGGERGALSEFARDLKTDPRVVHGWMRKRQAVIPMTWGAQIEKLDLLGITEAMVIAEDLAFLRSRKAARIAKRQNVMTRGKKALREQSIAA